jgi:hypothetical protein
MLGYDKPLYLIAFDHRGSFEHDLPGATEPVYRGAKSAAGASSAADDRASR